MPRIQKGTLRRLLWVAAVSGLILGSQPSLKASETRRTNLHVVVTDAEEGKPINQARLTLQFKEPSGKLKRSQMVSFSAKTDAQGRCRFTDIPMGTVRLLVTSERHESYGKSVEVDKDNQVIEVKLKKPQPQL